MSETIQPKKKTATKKVAVNISTSIETQPVPIKVFKTIAEIIADEKFSEYLIPTIKKAMNPKEPPKGMKYRSEPWKRMKAFGIDQPDKLMREFYLIEQFKSVESSNVRSYILNIVRDALQQVLVYYNDLTPHEKN